jgi:transcriptional regulator with XRE-family HTH domain
MKTTHSPPERERIGARIRAVRTEKGMRAPELGRLAGCSFNTVSDYERGVPVRMVLLPRFASALGVSLTWLETGEGERDIPSDQPAEAPRVLSAEFMHRCITVVAAWAPDYAAAPDRTALACRLYDMFHDEGATDEQMRRFLDRWITFVAFKQRQ